MDYREAFDRIVEEQISRVERMKREEEAIDFASMSGIIIGTVDGDGIGPVIMDSCRTILDRLLAAEIGSGRIRFRKIEGLTIENRLARGETLPKDVLREIKKCHVLLKGPTATPGGARGGPNLDIANVRPVSIPEKNIDWIFYRENTEGEYALGSRGVDINGDISIDFKVTTTAGTARLARAAFEYARKNGGKNVSIVTKANIMKKTDGKFLSICMEIARDYPEIRVDDWYVDIMAANLIDDRINGDFNVFILPNLYGDIITDEAAQIQGGVGTAGSANIGARYAMFEAIHGSAPRMIEEGIGGYASPESLCRAAVMMLRHIGLGEKAAALENALNSASRALDMTGDGRGNTAAEFTDRVLSEI